MRSVYLSILAAMLLAGASSADTFTVCASGCDYTSINEAINAASAGDTIQLFAETYYEGSSININGDKTLQGAVNSEGLPASIIDGQNLHRGIYKAGSTAYLENLVVQNCIAINEPQDSIFGGAIWANGTLWIDNCIIRNNGGRMAGIYQVGGTLNMSNCIFEGNSSPAYASCLSAYGGSINVSFCDFRDNTTLSSSSAAVRVFASGVAHFSATYIRNNSGHGFWNQFPNGNTLLTDMVICGNSTNLWEFQRSWDADSYNVCVQPNCDNCADIDIVVDTDMDGVPDVEDQCPGYDDTLDNDGDGTPDGCDSCPFDADDDADGDGICGDVDPCPNDQLNDSDGDGICGDVDACPNDYFNDSDGDGRCADVDAFPNDPNEWDDSDGDGLGDNEDTAPRGACCTSSGCYVLVQAACTGVGGTWLGTGGSCDDCKPVADECPADVDGDGSIGFSDVLIILNDWGACP